MSILPSYLRHSSYAQNCEYALRSGASSFEPLPSQFLDDKAVPPVVSISSDKMEVKFIGTRWRENGNFSTDANAIGPVKNSDQDAASVRANHPIPPSTGLFYFEATILSKGRDGFIGVGLCRQDVLLSRLPGWEDDSWGYHGDDGHSFCCQGTGKDYGPKFSTGDVIGCAINFASGECFYTKNGVHLGVAFTGLSGALYPSIGLRTIGEQVRVNFGAEPFVFDIDHYYRLEKSRLYQAVRDEEDDISARVQDLVSGYLSHNGYAESAQAMAVDISAQTAKTVSYPPIDMEASNRQKLRGYFMEGNVDAALAMLEELFLEVLQKHEILYFRIRCRKFIEMMRASAEEATVNTAMAIDYHREALSNTSEKSNDITMIESAEAPERPTKKDRQSLIEAAMLYGQSLHALYGGSADPSFRLGLEEAFSLLPYADPMNSPMAHLVSDAGRVQIAEDVNRAILTTSGKSARSELEEIVALLASKIGSLKDGGGAFINVHKDFLIEP